MKKLLLKKLLGLVITVALVVPSVVTMSAVWGYFAPVPHGLSAGVAILLGFGIGHVVDRKLGV